MITNVVLLYEVGFNGLNKIKREQMIFRVNH